MAYGSDLLYKVSNGVQARSLDHVGGCKYVCMDLLYVAAKLSRGFLVDNTLQAGSR